HTGARKMEILSNTWESFEESEQRLLIWSDKNKDWRKVPLTDVAFNALKAWRDEAPYSEFMFPMKTDSSRHVSGQIFDKIWNDAKKKAGIKGRARVHDMRHTFATRTAKDRWPVKAALSVLDMSERIYIGTYTH